MADETDTDTQAAEGDATSTETDSGGGSDGAQRALAAERKARRDAERALQAATTKLQAAEDKDKTETQRLQDAATVAEKRAADAEQQLLRIQVGADKGLTVAQARRLVGSTREELEADAADLLESFGGKKGDDAPAGETGKPEAGAGSRRPKEALRPGAAPAGTGDKPDPAAIAKKILSNPF
ncbi:hypothetical protein BBK14_11275 [Parafrankia soli]|uniref:DUF4355 domain-containing protein n=1 Tax=Parafrankia soli TaxID=2599596 RepID=A0A1S1R9L7_9ACTN|nr:hypothetical protein [Parafrankia soli]OHV42195.1 hypothetical protein BBK14_11275 [Parafrankia soli]